MPFVVKLSEGKDVTHARATAAEPRRAVSESRMGLGRACHNRLVLPLGIICSGDTVPGEFTVSVSICCRKPFSHKACPLLAHVPLTAPSPSVCTYVTEAHRFLHYYHRLGFPILIPYVHTSSRNALLPLSLPPRVSLY